MKKILIISILATICVTSTYGQTARDSVSCEYLRGKYNFYYKGKTLTFRETTHVMQSSFEAGHAIKSAQSANTLSTILIGAGGFLIGWPIGNLIDGSKPEWQMAVIGAGLIVVAIPIHKKVEKRIKRAVGIYNNSLKTSSFPKDKELRFGMTGNGIGLTMRY